MQQQIPKINKIIIFNNDNVNAIINGIYVQFVNNIDLPIKATICIT